MPFNHNTKEHRQWAEAVKRRDNYQCTTPGCNETRHLQAHHIEPASDRPDLAYNIDNGRTLCQACHNAVHGRRYANTGDDVKAANGRKKISDLDIDQVFKFIKTGCDLDTTLLALGIPAEDLPDIAEKLELDKSKWWDNFRFRLTQAQAAHRVMLVQKIFTQGGFQGAKFLLSLQNRREPQKKRITAGEPEKIIEAETW